MSERGSFVTQFIYCDKCFDECRKVFVKNDKYLKGVVIPSWQEGQTLPIIAGKIGGLGPGEELIEMQYTIKPKLDETLCHKIRISIMPDNGQDTIIVCGPHT